MALRPGPPDGMMRCELCGEDFDSPVELLLHEALEDDRLYPLRVDE